MMYKCLLRRNSLVYHTLRGNELHNGALTTPICKSSFSERLFSPISQSH
jgi:hypothetical protein